MSNIATSFDNPFIHSGTIFLNYYTPRLAAETDNNKAFRNHEIIFISIILIILLEIMVTLVRQKTEVPLPKYSIKKLILHEKNNIFTPYIIHQQF